MKERPSVGRHIVMFAVLQLPFTGAAGFEEACAKTKDEPELSICKDPELRQADVMLNKLYSRLRIRSPKDGALLQEQRNWLAERARCGSDKACLADRYRKRNAELSDALGYGLDDIDQKAVEELAKAIESERLKGSVVPIQRALARFEVKRGVASFSAEVQDGFASLPSRRPAGVSPEEWSALKKSGISIDNAENGNAHFYLADLDGDGLRDLVIDTYIGGTGLFNAVNAFRRVAGTFVGAAPDQLDRIDENTWYLLNGRGSAQDASWVRLQGRVYAAYTDGEFGRDTVSLLKPFVMNDRASALVVRYGYAFKVPQEQSKAEGSTSVLPPDLHAVLDAAVKKATSGLFSTADARQVPLCPRSSRVPASASGQREGEEAEEDGSEVLPSHYSFEVVTDLAVWFKGSCRPARLVDWFGRYHEMAGLDAMLFVKGADIDEFEEYMVTARRRVLDVKVMPPPSR